MVLPAATGCIAKVQEKIRDVYELTSDIRRLMPVPNYLFDVTAPPDLTKERFLLTDLESQRPFVSIWPDFPNAFETATLADGKVHAAYTFRIHIEVNTEQAVIDDPAIDPLMDNEIERWWHNLISSIWRDSHKIAVGEDSGTPLLDLSRYFNTDMYRNKFEISGLGDCLIADAVVDIGIRR